MIFTTLHRIVVSSWSLYFMASDWLTDMGTYSLTGIWCSDILLPCWVTHRLSSWWQTFLCLVTHIYYSELNHHLCLHCVAGPWAQQSYTAHRRGEYKANSISNCIMLKQKNMWQGLFCNYGDDSHLFVQGIGKWHWGPLTSQQGSRVGVTTPIFSVPLFSHFFEDHQNTVYLYIWQVSPQLSCRDTWQIWTWLKKSNLYFC